MTGNKQGQAVFEYAVVIAAICTVIVTMGIYGQRAVKGRLKVSADAISGAGDIIGSGLTDKVKDQEDKLKQNQTAVPGRMFSPRWSRYTSTVAISSKVRQTATPDGASETRLLDNEVTNVTSPGDDFSGKKLIEEKLFE